MRTSQTAFLSEIVSGGSLPLIGQPIPAGQRAYFQERLKGRIFSFIIGEFQKQQRKNPDITQATIARRLGKRPEQINRWLSGPSNLTLDTISDLFLAICGGEPSLSALPLHSAVQIQTLAERHQVADTALVAEAPPPIALSALEDSPLGTPLVNRLGVISAPASAPQLQGDYPETIGTFADLATPPANNNQPAGGQHDYDIALLA